MSGTVRGVFAMRNARRWIVLVALAALLAEFVWRSPAFGAGIIIFAVALLLSVMLHEAGHFVTAKLFGMQATDFFVGFGPTVWSFTRGETEYGVKAFPLGGFVRITGMTTMDDVDPAVEPRSFRGKPGWQRVIVLGAGSFMHFTIALVLLWLVAFGIGINGHFSESATSASITVLPCVPPKAADNCTASDPRSPAELAGLRGGDKIIAIAGTPIRNWTQMAAAIKSQQAGKPVSFTVVRDGRQFTQLVSLTLVSWHKGPYLGVEPTDPVEAYQQPGLLGSISYAGTEFGSITASSVHAFAEIPKAIPYLFSPNRANTPGGQVGSVVGAAGVTGQVVAAGIGWQQKIVDVLLIIISVNIFVGLFNLLPLLPMDGGHIATVLYERARSVVARLRHRPDPGLVDIRRLIPVSVGVFGVLVAFSLLLIAADIINPVHLLQ
jgi:membrane-associated protease RseP (regulator of RpoE activity)